MVAVGVGDYHMPNSSLLIDLEGPGDGAGIDGHDIIDQKGCHSTGRAVATKTTEDLEFHRTSITPARRERIQAGDAPAKAPKNSDERWTERPG